MGHEPFNDEDTPRGPAVGRDTSERIEVAAEQAVRRITGKQEEMRRHRAPWKAIAVGVAIALGSSSAGWLGRTAWAGLTAQITDGKADTTVVEAFRAEYLAGHATLTQAVEAVKKEQKASGRILRKVARKLKIEGVDE